jgi:hypothetical protein
MGNTYRLDRGIPFVICDVLKNGRTEDYRKEAGGSSIREIYFRVFLTCFDFSLTRSCHF